MLDTITARIAARMSGETYDEELMGELSQTVFDRLCLRLGVKEEYAFPSIFYSIVVDATIKAYRRKYYEGLSSETSGNISTSFVSDILAEYEPEIASYLDSVDTNTCINAGVGRVVRFL